MYSSVVSMIYNLRCYFENLRISEFERLIRNASCFISRSVLHFYLNAVYFLYLIFSDYFAGFRKYQYLNLHFQTNFYASLNPSCSVLIKKIYA